MDRAAFAFSGIALVVSLASLVLTLQRDHRDKARHISERTPVITPTWNSHLKRIDLLLEGPEPLSRRSSLRILTQAASLPARDVTDGRLARTTDWDVGEVWPVAVDLSDAARGRDLVIELRLVATDGQTWPPRQHRVPIPPPPMIAVTQIF